jgi:hypothetical protein
MDGSPVHTSSCAPLGRGEDEGDDKRRRRGWKIDEGGGILGRNKGATGINEFWGVSREFVISSFFFLACEARHIEIF